MLPQPVSAALCRKGVLTVRDFEREALMLLCASSLEPSQLHAAMNHPVATSCEFTGAGYYLELAHPDLPEGHQVCSEPMVQGVWRDQDVGFVAFITDSVLCLECYSYGNKGISESIRDEVVRVFAT